MSKEKKEKQIPAFRVEPEIHEKLSEIAQRENRTLSSLIGYIIKKFLEKFENEKTSK